MAILSLAADLRRPLERALADLPATQTQDLDVVQFRESLAAVDEGGRCALRRLSTCCRTLLGTNGFALIKGMPAMTDARGLVGLAVELGTVFQDLAHQSTAVVEASPMLESQLQGNQTEPLFLHTDFAMLETPPAVTIIHCRRPDPLGDGFGRNGLAVAQNIVSRHFGSQLLDDLYSVPLPFGGRTPSGQDVVLTSPLLLQPENGSKLTRVRFHPSRLHHGFRLRGSAPTAAETRLLRRFQTLVLEVRSEFLLEEGDMLLLNNRCALHDRTRCSLELSLQSVRSRSVHILFVQTLAASEEPT